MTRLFVSPLLLLPLVAAAQDIPLEPISVVADRLEMSSESGLSTYQGNVEMRQGSMWLRADSLQLKSSGNTLQSAIARGRPAMLERIDPQTDEQLKANATQIEYRISEGVLELKEGAHLWRGKDEFSGEHITYELDNQVVRASGGKEDGRVRVILQPDKESNE